MGPADRTGALVAAGSWFFALCVLPESRRRRHPCRQHQAGPIYLAAVAGPSQTYQSNLTARSSGAKSDGVKSSGSG